MIRASFVIAFLIGNGIASQASESVAADQLTFEQHIRPIFRAYCFDCHGASEDVEGGLDLRLVRFMKSGGDSGAAIVAGAPQDSLLIERIRDGEMPPGDHRVPEDQIATLERWIAAGSPTARPEPDSIGPGIGITPEERAYWAFQPIRRPALAETTSDDRVRNAIDSIVLSRAGDVEPAMEPVADRRTLIIRLYLDLIGLPPTVDQVQRWTDDPRNDWFERLVDELLESPHYGERWARHWLDVAGYADSEGYTTKDPERAWAWQYRDWVIRAFNDDKPFDQFITEQLAGDELAGPATGDLTAEQIELLTATGFLRMAADGTGGGANNDEARNQVMADTLKIVGTSLLGLSVQCAQCHDHRYDPIPQTDYYALRAVFEPALDWKAWKTPAARLVSLYTAEDRKQASEIEQAAKKIQDEKNKRQAEYMKQALDAELSKYEEPLRSSLRSAYETPSGKRNDEQKKLLSSHPSVNITPGNLYQYIPESRPKLAEFDKQINEVRSKKPPESFLRALVEPVNHVPDTKLFHRGDPAQPKQTISPGPLSVTSPGGHAKPFPSNDPSRPTTGRRLAFARWLTDRDNPLFARVIVNRVWMHHFGKGLVATPGEFGKLGAMPSDPELLDWLAAEFIEQGFRMKSLHRLILTSTLWQQATVPTSPNSYARTLRRLEAETLRDRMLSVSGTLDRSLFGAPIKIKQDDAGQVVVDGQQTRRSLYIQSRRSSPVAMLQTFDAPVMETNCERRESSTVATQSLMLLNGQFILDQAARMADRVAREAEPLTADQLASLPTLPIPNGNRWQYGYGSIDQESGQTTFTAFPHWTGTDWRGGEKLPDSKLGWALLNAGGGHPDISSRSVIRRWIADRDGKVAVRGTLGHGSPNGDGVRGSVVSSRIGVVEQWVAQHSTVTTAIPSITIKKGDTIDFVTDCRDNHTSDSFSWDIQLVVHAAETDGEKTPETTIISKDQFSGPGESVDALPGQIVRAWQLAYCRSPRPNELTLAMDFIANQIETMNDQPQAIPSGRTATRQAMTNLCQSLMSSNEFLYVE